MNSNPELFYPENKSIETPQTITNNVSSIFTSTYDFNKKFYDINPPKKGTPICFGFGSSIVLGNNVSKIFNIRNLIMNESIPNIHHFLKLLNVKKEKNELSQIEQSNIKDFLRSEKEKVHFFRASCDYLQKFRNSCLIELLLLISNRGYLINNPNDYNTVFSDIGLNIEFGIWKCCCDANGKPIEFVSKRSLLGLCCSAFGVSKTLEMYEEKKFGSNNLIELEISWSDRFALSVLCGERKLSSCYFDYVKNKSDHESNSGIKCECFESVLDLLYLCFVQKTEYFRIDEKFLELWPYYIHSVIATLGTSSLGSKSLLRLISNKFLSDIKDQKSKLSLNEKIFGWQFCTLLSGEYKEITCGINTNNIKTYIIFMDIIALFFAKSNKWNLSLLSNEHSLLYRFWSSLYFSDIGDFERATFYMDTISSLISTETTPFKEKLKKELEFLKIRIQEKGTVQNRKILSNKNVNNEQSYQIQSTSSIKNSSWLVGWISSNIKKAMGSDEEHWPGVENTFYYDKEIKQWRQRGTNDQKPSNEPSQIRTDLNGTSSEKTKYSTSTSQSYSDSQEHKKISLPPPPSKQGFTSSNYQSNYSTIMNKGGVRSRYVDVFQEKKQY